MPQIDPVLPQVVFLRRLNNLIQRRGEGLLVLWQGSLELKCV